MIKLHRPLALATMAALLLASCSFGNADPTPAPLLIAQPTASLSQLVVIELTVQVDTTIPFNTVGQVVQYKYNIHNTGSTSTPGPVSVTGGTCPEISTVGNFDTALDVNETLVCTSSYTITQADLDRGSVTNIVTATVNGISSNQATTTVPIVKPATLKLAKAASPIIYDHAGQVITYTYVITNEGTSTLGPAQFTVTDAGLSAPVNCGEATLSLASNATVSCSASYTITQANMDSGSVETSATASGGGASPSQPASATVTKGTAAQSNPSAANLTAGSTIKHQVAPGEWLIQIARCYGVTYASLRAANPQLANPGQIAPNTTISIPNIGSAGNIYGPPCIGTHTVQSGDTWASIALKYNADPTVLQMVNANSLSVGKVLVVPLNSAGSLPAATTGSGNCVDLTRSIKFSNTNANPTHFNICGQKDAAGNTKIASIGIKQRPEDVGQGGLVQDIPSVPVDTSTPLNDPNSLIVGDMNYDGYDDFRIVRNIPAGPNIPYVYYLFDPASLKFVYNKAYENITSPEFTGNLEIRSKWRDNAVKWGVDTYTITNNTPRLTRRETWEAINETQAKHQVMVFNADGTSQVTVDETVTIPNQ
ncbi:MAG: LysM peptidoglycan-binding domain-containing protein [Chloroflexi bacterium]|nr:LysM peptidoglycan-binding domain-containing protein [Chloroflexota bacterium]